MQQTSWQKTLEVVVKGFVGAIVALAGLWVLGWVFTFLGSVLIGLAGIIAALLKFLVPVAVIAAIVYFFVSQMRPNDKTIDARVHPKPLDQTQAVTVDTAFSTSAPAKVEVSDSDSESSTPASVDASSDESPKD